MAITTHAGYEIPLMRIPMVAPVSLAGHVYKPVYLSAENEVRLMTAKDLSQHFLGVLGREPEGVASENVDVIVAGIVKVQAQSSFSAGDYLTVADSQGRVDVATDNEPVIGMALEAASAQDHIVSMLILNCPIKGDNT